MTQPFSRSRVISRNFIIDMFQGVRNLLGLEMRGYSEHINRQTKEIFNEVYEDYDVDWMRVDIGVDDRSMIVTVYGEGVKTQEGDNE